MRNQTERGIAMITALLVLMLMSALLVGFTTIVISDQRYRFIDRDRGQAFYGASGSIEKLTSDLGNLFLVNIAPTAAQVTALTAPASQPSIAGITFASPSAPTGLPASQLTTYHCKAPKTIRTVGTNGYTITFCASGTTGNPTVSDDPTTITTGAYEGLIAQQTPYQLDVTARTATGGEVHLVRTIEAVAIPVFQFGMFSDVDLSFFAGSAFDFGGRVHTNGNLFLSEGSGGTLTLRDKVTAVGEIVRQQMQNGASIDAAPAHTGTVNMARASGVFRAFLRTEGSVVDGATSAQNEPLWHSTSLSTYNSWIRNSRTGAKLLVLPLISVGGTNPDLIRRPAVNEDTTNGILLGERLYSKASLRILLSDTAADITNLPTVTATAPVLLDGDWVATPPNNGTAYGPINASHPPIATSSGASASTLTAAAAANATTLTVTNDAGSLAFKPVLTLGGVSVTCTDKTANSFTGCVGTPAAVVNSPVTWKTASTTLSVATVLNAATITVQAGGTANFVPLPFWLATVAGATQPANNLVACTGYTATTFTGCWGVPAAANGSSFKTNVLSSAGTGTIGGYIKIDRGNADGTWTDVTMEILNYGIGGPNLSGQGQVCADPTPNAILRIQRLRGNQQSGVNGGGCNYAGSTTATDYWPNVLFDPREALQRDTSNPGAANLPIGGVMHYITIDAANLAKWFRATVAPYNAGTGASSRIDNTGYTVYFSDRRNNRTAASLETGEYGWEDFVNPLSATGAPNGALDTGEDVNGSGALDTYGGIPNYLGVSGNVPPGAAAPLVATARPTTTVSTGQAQVNRAIVFRHALKLVNGSALAPTISGLTVVSENPVYLQGNWNAAGSFAGAHAATSVIADAVTLLSNEWTDSASFSSPYAVSGRARTSQSWYRVAIVSGKGEAFLWPTGTQADFGTDGGAHNFLRFLENGAQAVNYLGSIATFFYNRQGVGTYKYGAGAVYDAPTRNFAFDVDFLNPALLPPNTPVFRDMNTVGFSQDLRPGR